MIRPLIFAAILLITGISAPARSQDNIGIFWDSNYTDFSTTTESIPEIMTGHLVLKDPSTTSGLSGWECCAEVDGPGQFISWVFEGQATNFTSSPCFRVGISGPPLPSQADILLATFEIMVTEFQAVTLSLRPDYIPSVPGQMSFYLADDPGTPVPMTTTTGLPEVAWVNGGNGWIIDPGDGLDFGQYWVNGIKELSVTIENTGDLPIPVLPSVADSCPAFYPVTGSFSIDPGAFGTVVVGFSPLEAIEYDCALDLGLVLPDIPLIGTGSDSTSWTAPTYHDFGHVGVGLAEQYFTFDISNTGSMGFQVSVSLPDTTQSFFRPPVSFFLNPGQTQTTSVWFKPVVPGHHSLMLDLGEVLPPVLLEGDGDPRPMGFSVVPDTIDFGWNFLGETKYEALFIYNTGGTFLDLGVYLAHPELGFSITRGYGSFLLPPGDEYLVHILYEPEELGIFSTDLNLGPMLPPAFITGAAESPEDICTNLPDTLVFGPINAGGSQTISYSVTNSSHQDISISPFTHNSPIFLADGWTTVGPGEAHTFDVTFQPQLPLNYTGTLTLNSKYCSDITLVGTATAPVGTDQNLVGIFFDPAYSIIDTKTFQPNQMVQSYLVMLNPSETSGVGSWELAVDIEGDAHWLGWVIEGQYINIGSNNEFIVGLMGSPLPYAPEILLATGYLMVIQPYPNLVDLELKPVWNASLPGQMAWAPWHDDTMLMPLLPLTGQSIVAGINWNSASEIEVSTLVAETRLLPNVPNPFNPMTEIRFELDRPQQVRVTVYDVTGRLVKVLVEGQMEAGPHTRIWQGRDSGGRQVPSGVYYVRMVAGEKIDHLKIMLLK